MIIGQWKFFEKRLIHDLRDLKDVYLVRWILISGPPGGIFLHHILRPDHDRALHDHPWSFVSIGLKGGVAEQTTHAQWVDGIPGESIMEWDPGRIVAHWPGRWYFRRAERLHRIDQFLDGDTAWTLVVHGPRRRTWGFSPRPGEWVDWESYCAFWEGIYHLDKES